MTPFLVNMWALFELFVYEWLKAHLPEQYELKKQETIEIGQENRISFRIDLVIIDRQSGEVYCVLDTKYKVPDAPSTRDIGEIFINAGLMHCSKGVLIYPQKLKYPLKTTIENVKIWTATFALDGDLEQAGAQFMQEIGVLGT